eukprot:CAMPEP_0196586368 /NCGR_PEP_ID=MMETSP1081-20130531/54022_1 /TAXON_ID=36882 /ORGANISM="Pyramimonas amylifera, Strain CCMP720" /LENGTH=61 /DNA_ID=CAMNT_0041908225 /DNA_START=515 /DNA_END=700 /DNA_ORIENTATION=-
MDLSTSTSSGSAPAKWRPLRMRNPTNSPTSTYSPALKETWSSLSACLWDVLAPSMRSITKM